MKNPLVSIITPCYNGEHCVRRLFDSVIAQTYRPIEFILVNDGSTDDTLSVVEEYRPRFKDAGIDFICHTQENLGLGGAINPGLKRITGEYFCWPDADDYLEPTSLADRVEVFQKNSDCAVVTSDAYIRDYNDLNSYSSLLETHFPHSKEMWQFDLFLNGNSIFCSGCHMIKLKAFDTVNPEREIYPARRGQNWQLLLPVYYRYKRVFLDKPLYNYVINPSSMSKDRTKEDRLYRYREHYEILTNTLKMIEDVQKGDLVKYYRFLEDKYAKLNLHIAVAYSDWELFRTEYAKKQETVGIDRLDLVFYLIYLFRLRLPRRAASYRVRL